MAMSQAAFLLFVIALSSVQANYYGNRNYQQQRYPPPQNTAQRPVRGPPPGLSNVGFVGGPQNDVTTMSMYRSFRMFLALIEFKRGNGQQFVQRNGQIILAPIQCQIRCPPPLTFCDNGICRCKRPLMALHGTCWKHHEGVIEDTANWELKKAEIEKLANPHMISCSSHRTCQETDINLICRYDIRKCQCREPMRWNHEEAECQVFVPVVCPKIVNGTVVDDEEDEKGESEEDEVEELEDLERELPQTFNQQYQPTNQFDQQRRYNEMVQRKRQQMGRRFNQQIANEERTEDEEEQEEEEEEEPVPNMLIKLDPYTTNEFDVKDAFCHDLTIFYKNFTAENEGGEYFFAPFKSTPLIVAIFIIFAIVITGVCFYAFTQTHKTEKFIRKSFKVKRVDTDPDFHNVDDSDDERPTPSTQNNHASSSANNKNPRLFSTPQHNPNNPFNATPTATPKRQR